MKNIIRLTLTLILTSQISSVHADGVCHRCEQIREYNKNHPENDYYWYDDYLKDQEGKKNQNQTEKKVSSINKKSKTIQEEG